MLGDAYAGMPVKEAMDKYTADYGSQMKREVSDFEQDTEAQSSADLESEDMDASDHLESPEYELITDSILYNQNDLLCYSVYREYSTGMPTVSRSYTYWVVDLKTGKRVMENDIFIVDAIAVANNVDKVADLENIGFYNVNEIYPNRNFYVDDIGITYTFNENDIATNALGATTVRIPYEMIRHLLRKDSPIAHLAF